jgi:hypothetical protein
MFDRPDDCLAEAGSDPELTAWLATWRNRLDHGQVTTSADSMKRLHDCLDSSPLPCIALLDVGRAVQFISDDSPVVAMIFATVALRSSSEIAEIRNDPIRYRWRLLNLNSARPDLWDAVQHGDQQYAAALKVLCDEIAEWPGRGDQVLDIDSQYAAIISAQCMALLGHPDDALKAMLTIRHRRLNDGQMRSLNWAYETTLAQIGHDDEALQLLEREVATKQRGPHHIDALVLLVEIATRHAKLDVAQAALEKLKQEPSTNPQTLQKLESELSHAGHN